MIKKLNYKKYDINNGWLKMVADIFDKVNEIIDDRNAHEIDWDKRKKVLDPIVYSDSTDFTDDKKDFSCLECGQGFNDAGALVKHWNDEHAKEMKAWAKVGEAMDKKGDDYAPEGYVASDEVAKELYIKMFAENNGVKGLQELAEEVLKDYVITRRKKD